jgi:hypothetical protein
MRCKQLSHRCLDLGLSMDNRNVHRALADVDMVCDVLDLWDMEEVIAYWKIPDIYIRAMIPPPWVGRGGDGGVGRDLAKAAGFGYERAPGTDNPYFEKQWVKRVKHVDPSEYPFEVRVVK